MRRPSCAGMRACCSDARADGREGRNTLRATEPCSPALGRDEDLSSNGTGGSVSTGGRTGGTGGSVAGRGATDGDGGSGSGGDQSTTGGSSSDGGTTSGGAGPTGGSNAGGSSTGVNGGGSAGSNSMGPATVFEGSGVLVESSDYSSEGSFFILEDSVKDGELVVTPLLLSDLDGDGASADEPSTFDGAEAPCVGGTIAMVTDPDGESCELVDAACDWGSLWGGGIGLTLNQPEDTALTWDATAEGITGFEFVTSIAASGPPYASSSKTPLASSTARTSPTGPV